MDKLVQAAAGRDADDVSTAARCLLSLVSGGDPSPEQIAGAHLLAFALSDLRRVSLSLAG